MAGKNGNGNEPTRKPFKKGEEEQTFKLLGKTVIAIDDAKEKIKKHKSKLESLKEDIRKGGYLEDPQQVLPVEEEEDLDEARQ